VTQVLIALAAIAGYAVFLLIRPDKTCRACAGWGAKGRRRSFCRRCGGTGRRFRRGARLVHYAAAEGYRYLRTRKEVNR
jgi:DnaJ-class molecular chaperone